MRKSLLLFLVAGCAPDLGTAASLVTSERVIAVVASPAEVHPGDAATYAALLVSPSGTSDPSSLTWSLCTSPKPLSENDTVARACLDDASSLLAVGTGDSVMATIPDDACQRFGPDPPPQKAGDPPLRPRDPDVTGGYYQPLRVDEPDESAFPLQRIACNLAEASANVVADFAMRYTLNENPVLVSVTEVGTVAADTDVALRAEWSAASAETFPVLDRTTFSLVDQRESMRVSWFTTAGTLALDRSGRDATDPGMFAENTWHTPKTPGPVSLWVVLRDSRGGSTWKALTANVQ